MSERMRWDVGRWGTASDPLPHQGSAVAPQKKMKIFGRNPAFSCILGKKMSSSTLDRNLSTTSRNDESCSLWLQPALVLHNKISVTTCHGLLGEGSPLTLGVSWPPDLAAPLPLLECVSGTPVNHSRPQKTIGNHRRAKYWAVNLICTLSCTYFAAIGLCIFELVTSYGQRTTRYRPAFAFYGQPIWPKTISETPVFGVKYYK